MRSNTFPVSPGKALVFIVASFLVQHQYFSHPIPAVAEAMEVGKNTVQAEYSITSKKNGKKVNARYAQDIFLHLPRGGHSEHYKRRQPILPKQGQTDSLKQKRSKIISSSTIDRTTFHRGGRGGDQSIVRKKSQSLIPLTLKELPQFLSISTMMFLFIYIFTTVRDTKDTLVVSNCGAEAIPFLKLYGVMPCAILFLMGYSKLSGLVGKEVLFYATLIPFFAFYVIFAFVLFPNREWIHFVDKAVVEGVSGGVGGAGKAAENLLRYWSYSLYFIVSELWASAGVPLLFWQCANDVTELHQAKRFYPLFAVIGNLAPIVSGKVMSYIVSFQTSLDDVGFGQTLQKLAYIKVMVCIGIIVLYKSVYAMAEQRKKEKETREIIDNIVQNTNKGKKINVSFQHRKNNRSSHATTYESPKKKQTSLRESMRELSKSPELRAMATMVICYNACIELTEVLWKGLLRQLYPNKSAYMTYMANFSQKVGIVALILQFVASTIIRKLGWKWTSRLTPLTMIIMALPFFGVLILSQGTNAMFPLATALMIGTWQNVASKVTKYSLFDPCKEMAYIPLGPEAKVKGKAAVDVMGARFGRSIGSASQQLLVLLVGGGNILHCVPFIGVLYVTLVGFWMRAVGVLSELFVDDNKKEKKSSFEK